MIYVIRPKQELTDVLGDEVNWFYTQPHAWESDEYIGTSLEPAGSTYPTLFMKLIFMLELVNYTQHPQTKQELQKLLGNPLKFNIEMFDKWWVIERIKSYKSQELTLKYTSTDKIAMLDSKGYEHMIDGIFFERQLLTARTPDTE